MAGRPDARAVTCTRVGRHWAHALRAGAFGAPPNQPRCGQPSARTPASLDAVRITLESGQRTWTAAQLADWIATQYGIRVSTGRLRIHLKRAKLSYQRTSRSLKHKQQGDAVLQTQTTLAALEKRGSRD